MLNPSGFTSAKYAESFGAASGQSAMYWGQPRGEVDRHDRRQQDRSPPRHDFGRDRYMPTGYDASTKKPLPPRYTDVVEPLTDDAKTPTVSSLMTDFVGNTSLQGLPFVFKTDKWLPKLFWTSIFLCAFAATVFQFYLVLSKYFLRETTTKIEIGYDNLDFPSISFCNLNPIRRSAMLELADTNPDVDNLKGFMGQFRPPIEYEYTSPDLSPVHMRKKRAAPKQSGSGGETMGPQPFDLQHDPEPPPLRQPAISGWNFTSGRYLDQQDPKTKQLRQNRAGRDNAKFGGGAQDPQKLIREEFHSIVSDIDREVRPLLGHSLKLMMLDCVFNGRLCQASNFSTFLDPNYGNCYTFNGADQRSDSLQVLASGVDAGLNMLLYVENTEHLAGIAEGAGMRVAIHPFKTMPFLWKNGVSVPVGLQTYIGLAMTNMSRMGTPYHACNDDTTYLKEFNRKYTKEMCINTCTDRLIAKNCSCYRREALHLYPPEVINGTSKLKACNSKNGK